MFKYPSFVQINLTNACNLRCSHCFNDSGETENDEITNEEVLNLLDYFLSRKIVCITFGGGEPLLRKDIFKLIEYSVKRGGRITLLSNGVLVDKVVIKKLENLGIHRIRISLDGSSRKLNDHIRSKGSFDGAMGALKLLGKSRIPEVTVTTTVNKLNLDDLENIVKLLISTGIKNVKFIPTILNGRAIVNMQDKVLNGNFAKKMLRVRMRLSKKYKNQISITSDSPLEAIIKKDGSDLEHCGPCLIGTVFLGIKSNGDIFSCPMLDNVIIGNIRTNDIQSLWNNSKILKKVRDLKLLKDKCHSCKIVKYCGGGCRAMALIKYGDILMPVPFCWINN